MSEREARWWSVDRERERLYATEIEEAVQEWYDDLYPDQIVPETVEVHGFAPMELPPAEKIAADVLEYVGEWLEEDYGDPDDGGPTNWNEKAKAAAAEFARVVREEFYVWACEPVARETVRVADYVNPERAPESEVPSQAITDSEEP